jgi:hypothetical protein
MAMTYVQAYALATNAAFVQRIAMALANYANYILGSVPSMSATYPNTVRFNWAINAIPNPQVVAANIAYAVALDPNVQSAGIGPDGDSLIADQGAVSLDSAVQTVCNNTMMPAPGTPAGAPPN